MSEQQQSQVASLQRPTTNDRDEWKAYWTAQSVPWRMEPEIAEERRQFLAERRTTQPNIQQGIYPFKDIVLGRVDIEWLLATHENGRGPVLWDDGSQRQREGLDLRGARLRQIYLEPDLTGLPLAHTIGGLSLADLNTLPDHMRPQAVEAAAVQFEGVRAWRIDLRGSMLMGASFAGVEVWDGHFERAFLLWARFRQSRLIGPHFEGADCILATFEQVQFPGAHFEGASLSSLRTAQVDFFESHFEGAECYNAHFEGARFGGATLHGANFGQARLEGAVLDGAHLDGKELSAEEVARLRAYKPDFPSVLAPADLRGAVLNSESSLVRCIMGDEKFGGLSLADARLSETNLAVVDWTYTRSRFLGRHVEAFELGDVREAQKPTNQEGRQKSREEWITGHKDAVRANRQLATALRSQGLNEDADRFAYKAQKLQRKVLRRQRRYGAFLGSSLLDMISGYGYRPWFSAIIYACVVLGFAAVYFVLRDSVHPALNPLDSIIFSITSFHGRGFSAGEAVTLHNPITILAPLEAIIGLLIEITFIATFTNRFFAR